MATSNSEHSVITGYSSVSSAAVLFVSSIFTLIISGVGIVGTIFMWRIFLIIYAVVVGLIAILQFASAIVAFSFIDNARDNLNDNFESAIKRFRVFRNESDYNSEVNDAVTFFQEKLKCCGAKNASDWIRWNLDAVQLNNNLPPGKCECVAPVNSEDEENCVPFTLNVVNITKTTGYVWKEGCVSILEATLVAISVGSGVLSFLIMCIEIVFVIMAIGLAVYITKATKFERFV